MSPSVMQHEVDWRHWLGAAVLLALLVFGGWSLLQRPAPLPTSEAPRGPQARMQDALEAPPPIPPGQ